MASPVLKTVYFVRHGQSADNAAPVFQSPDSPLNEKGREQARCIAERASELSFESLITSTFKRARETAEAIERKTGSKAESSELFVERRKPSSINSKPFDDEAAVAAWREWEESLYAPGRRVEDGENFDDVLTRADRALAFLEDREEKSLMVVTHGYFLRTIVARVLFGKALTGESFRHFQRSVAMENTGLTVLRYHGDFEVEPRWTLWTYNDHAHLG